MPARVKLHRHMAESPAFDPVVETPHFGKRQFVGVEACKNEFLGAIDDGGQGIQEVDADVAVGPTTPQCTIPVYRDGLSRPMLAGAAMGLLDFKDEFSFHKLGRLFQHAPVLRIGHDSVGLFVRIVEKQLGHLKRLRIVIHGALLSSGVCELPFFDRPSGHF